MNLERYKTTKKDLFKSAGYLIASAATIYGSFHFVNMSSERRESIKNIDSFFTSHDSSQLIEATEEDQEKFDKLFIGNTPQLKLLTPDQQFYLNAAYDNVREQESSQVKFLLTLPFILPAAYFSGKENFGSKKQNSPSA